MVFLRVLSCVSCSIFLVQLLWFCDIELVNVFFGMCVRVLLIYWSGGYDIEIVMGPAFGIQSLYSTYREIEPAMFFFCARCSVFLPHLPGRGKVYIGHGSLCTALCASTSHAGRLRHGCCHFSCLCLCAIKLLMVLLCVCAFASSGFLSGA